MNQQELSRVFQEHFTRYPLMQPQDSIKLLYQNEFGPGHMISDAIRSLEYLKKEYAGIKYDDGIPLWEDIGNGLVRVNLTALDMTKLSLERLNEVFLQTANQVKGSQESFKEKIDFLYKNLESFPASFTRESLASYLTKYQVAGYPMVSHSEIYRTNYHPAYRVVKEEYYYSSLLTSDFQ